MHAGFARQGALRYALAAMPCRRNLLALIVSLTVPVLAAADAGALDDAALARLLEARERGVIYLWSPHMPYSATGAVEASTLARTLRLPLTLALDPQADAQLAARARARLALPAQALQRARAQALHARGATLHFPTVMVYRDGRLDAQMLPGYTPPAALAEFLQERLAP